MANKIVAVLLESRGYWAWTNSQMESLRPGNCLCLNCQGQGCGTFGGCLHEQMIMELCAENDLSIAVCRCPVWQASAKSRIEAVRQQHYGMTVWVSPALESFRKDQCLCLHCQKCRPGQKDHCFMADRLYRICRRGHLAMVISRCPEWQPK